jgi:hypothetical protein
MLTARSRAKEALREHRDATMAAARESESWLLYAGWFFVALGSALRIVQYGANRSLSIDESYLALNLIEKSPWELLRALDFNQAAPIGFLEAEKLTITILGRDEYALRLLPLLASLLAIVVFYRVTQKLLRPLAATAAVAAFALLDPLVYYSATVKQYTFDVAGAVVILALALVLERRPLRRLDLLALTFFGGFLVWFSHASVFALGGLALLLGINSIGARDWRRTAALLAMIAVWAASFAVEFLLSRSNLTGILGSFGAGQDAFLTPRQGGPSLFDRGTDRLRYLVGLEDTASGHPILASLPAGVNRGLTVLILLVAIAGFLSLVRRRTRFALALATPTVIAAVASAAHQYPLVGRTLLFVIPSLALCIGEGAQVLLSMTARRSLTTIAAAVMMSSLAAIAILPAIHVVRPRTSEEMKQALTYLGIHHRRNDTLYVSKQAQYAFAYYHLCGCSTFDPRAAWSFSTTSGRRDEGEVAVESRTPKLIIEASPVGDESISAAIKSLIGRARVWVLFADAPDYQKKPLLDYLDRYGRRLQRFRASGPPEIAASLYLYDLRARARR